MKITAIIVKAPINGGENTTTSIEIVTKKKLVKVKTYELGCNCYMLKANLQQNSIGNLLCLWGGKNYVKQKNGHTGGEV